MTMCLRHLATPSQAPRRRRQRPMRHRACAMWLPQPLEELVYYSDVVAAGSVGLAAEVCGSSDGLNPAALTLTTPAGQIFFFFQAEDGIRDKLVTGVQTCALPI